MSLDPATRERIRAEVAERLAAMEPIFIDTVRLTLVARALYLEDGDVVVVSADEDLEAVARSVRRAAGRLVSTREPHRLLQPDLSPRALRCDAWRWLPGMLAFFPKTGAALRVIQPADRYLTDEPGDVVPDLDDPATFGGLLALVCERHREPRIGVFFSTTIQAWIVARPGDGPLAESYTSKEEALVVALEARP